MRTLLISVLIILCSTSSIFADTPVIAFYVVKTSELKELIPEGGKLEDVCLLRMEDISTAKGYFEGDCNFYLKTDNYQYRFKARRNIVKPDAKTGKHKHKSCQPDKQIKNDNLVFSFRMFSQENKKNVFSSSGEMKVKEKVSAKKDWRQEEYTVLFRWENLSR